MNFKKGKKKKEDHVEKNFLFSSEGEVANFILAEVLEKSLRRGETHGKWRV